MPDSTKARKCRQKREAVQGVLFFAAVRIAAGGILLWGSSLAPEFGWLQILLGVLALMVGVPVLFAGIAFKERWKEIEGGELDAAAEY